MNQTGLNNPIFGLVGQSGQLNSGMNNMGMGNGMNNMGTGMNNMGTGMNNMGMNQNMMNMMNMGMMNNMPMMMQMNQMSQMNMSQMGKMTNQNSGDSNNYITIYFRLNDRGGEKPIAVQCLLTDLVSDIIQKYRNKSLDNDVTKKFIFNAKALDPKMSAEKAGLSDQATIFVVTTKNVKGA